MPKQVFAPGCALMIYKPELAKKVHAKLNEIAGEMDLLLTCCHHDPQFTETMQVINICPGCDKRFGKDYENSTTISLWEVLANSDSLHFPDYGGQQMTILDACPTREKENVHKAIRTLLNRMNINLIEPKNTGTKSTCCSDSFYGLIPVEKVKEQMRKRTAEMPVNDVVVYCISCVNSITLGGKKPRYLVDLLFAEETVPKTIEPDAWHKEIDDYIEKH